MVGVRRTLLGWLIACGLGLGSLAACPAIAEEHERAPASPDIESAGETLSLEQAIATALALNPRVREAEENLGAAQAAVIQARAADSVTANVEVLHTRVSEVSDFVVPVSAPPPDYVAFEKVSIGQEKRTQGTLTVAKPLYTGGRIPAAVQQARAGAVARSEESLRTLQSVANDTRQAYYGVLLAADLVGVAQQTVEAAREHLRVARARLEAGAAPEFDVLRAEARAAQSEQGLIEARNRFNLARAALNHAMGVPQDREYDLTTSFVEPTAAIDELETLVAQAQDARPELRQVQAQVDAAGAAINLVRSEKRPSLGASWVYQRILDTGAFEVESSWTLALQASLTIFNGKQTSAAIARARREQESSRALLEQVRQGVALEVRQAYLSLGSARERIVAATKGVEQAEEAYRIAIVRYDAGVGITVEVIDAEVALASARNDYVRAVYDYNIAVAQLEHAVGAWQPPQLVPHGARP